MVEPKAAVVHPIETHFVTTVADPDAREGAVVCRVPDGHKEAVDAVVDLVNIDLGEDGGDLGPLGGPTNPVLLGGLRGGC